MSLYSSPMPSSNYGFNVTAQNDTPITSTISGATTALDVNFASQSNPITISKNTSANGVSNPIFTSLVSNGYTLAVDQYGAITTNSTLTVPQSGILVTVNEPSSGIKINGTVTVTAASTGLPVSLVVPTSGINVNVLTNEDIKPRINDYQTTAVTKLSSAGMTHTITADSNVSAWTVGSDADMTFTLISGDTKMVARTSAAQRQVQIMFPTALLATGNITVNVVNEDKGDNGTAFSVINGYQQ
jgi:hypothetical protein